MGKHTPGIWLVGEEEVYTDANIVGNIICDKPDFADSQNYWQANANLIAAAPDLLEACEDAIGIVQAAIVNARQRNEYSQIIAALEQKEANIRAAIAKARGEK
jgi:hypothetical protein